MTDTGHRTGLPAGVCRRCEADLVWAWVLGQRGQRVPLEPGEWPDPADTRARYAVSRDHLGRLRARLLDAGERPGGGERLGMSHLTVCPVLLERREARTSLRRAKAAAPSPYDTEALAEARQRPPWGRP